MLLSEVRQRSQGWPEYYHIQHPLLPISFLIHSYDKDNDLIDTLQLKLDVEYQRKVNVRTLCGYLRYIINPEECKPKKTEIIYFLTSA